MKDFEPSVVGLSQNQMEQRRASALLTYNFFFAMTRFHFDVFLRKQSSML